MFGAYLPRPLGFFAAAWELVLVASTVGACSSTSNVDSREAPTSPHTDDSPLLDADCTAIEQGTDRGAVCVLLASCARESGAADSTYEDTFFASCSATSDTEVTCGCESPAGVESTFVASATASENCAAMVNLCRRGFEGDAVCTLSENSTDSSCALSANCRHTDGGREWTWQKSSTRCAVQTDSTGKTATECVCESTGQRLKLSVPVADKAVSETCSEVADVCEQEFELSSPIQDCAENEDERYDSDSGCRRQWDCVADAAGQGVTIHRDVSVECDDETTPGQCACYSAGHSVLMPRPTTQGSACDAVLQPCAELSPPRFD